MAPQSQSPGLLIFGPFEVNSQTSELRKSGIRVRLSGQPFRILLLLLEHPGDLVTRDQLREQLWNEGTFVDFEGGLNAAINKLRRALSDSAENPRYIETVPARGYRFVGRLEHRGSAVVPFPARSVPREHERRGRGRWLWVAATVAGVAVAFVLGWRFHDTPDVAPSWKLSQLTTDAGLSGKPALPADGKLIAYSSDRGLESRRDLYVKQVAGGEPIRLTFDGAGNTTPDFSPDGARIVFRSNRDGGGIYEIPAFGGEARLLARDGLDPKFSPDGSQVAFWIGAPNVAVPGSGAVWVVPSAGGPPRRIGSSFTDARYPIWSPDGKHLLLVGCTSRKGGSRLVGSAGQRGTAPANQPVPGSGSLRTGSRRRGQ